MPLAIVQILLWLIRLYSLILLGRVLASWIDPMMRSPIAQLLVRLTEPVLAPIRRLLPPAGPVDWSPLVLFLLLQVLAQIVARLRW